MAIDLAARLAATESELRVLAAAVRQLIDATVGALVAAARHVDAAVALLAPHRPAEPAPRYPAAASTMSAAEMMPFDPIMGPLNPIAPPIVFSMDGERSRGLVQFGTAYEGPPGCVHGGVLALAFDQVLNVANLMAGAVGPTKRLTLTFRKPTPLYTDLVFEGWVEQRSAREVHTRGRLLRGDIVTVEAEGVFALLSPERVMALLAAAGSQVK
jgi:Thioesterase superfamily